MMSANIMGDPPIRLTAKSRDDWMDVLRGVAILLVILVHSYQMASMYSGHQFARLLEFNIIVDPLRMPMLFLLSGMLVPRSLEKGMRTYASGKLRRIAYPYFLWSFLLFGMFILASATIGWAVDPGLVWRIFYDPIEQMWFLAYLLAFYAVAGATQRFPTIAVMLGVFVLYVLPFGGRWSHFWGYAIFFLIGMVITQIRPQFDRAKGSVVGSWLILFAAASIVLIAHFTSSRIPGAPWNAPIVVALVIGLAGILTPIAGGIPFAPLRYVGKNSLIFFLLHWPAIIFGLKIIKLNFDPGPWQYLLSGIALGVIVPLLFALAANRVRAVNAIFSFPEAGKRPSLKPTVSEARGTEQTSFPRT